MWSSEKATAAHLLIESLIAPRRERLRQAMLLILRDSRGDSHPSAHDTLALVHELCASELAVRIRIMTGELKKVYAGETADPPQALIEDLRQEVEHCIQEEMDDLVNDERQAAAFLEDAPPRHTEPPPAHP